jgi:hypothetical protein
VAERQLPPDGNRRNDWEKDSGELRPKKKTPIDVVESHDPPQHAAHRHRKQLTVRTGKPYFRMQGDRTLGVVQRIEPFCDALYQWQSESKAESGFSTGLTSSEQPSILWFVCW